MKKSDAIKNLLEFMIILEKDGSINDPFIELKTNIINTLALLDYKWEPEDE